MILGFYIESYDAGGVDTVIENKIKYWPNRQSKFIIFYNNSYKYINLILKKNLKKKITFIPINILSLNILSSRYFPIFLKKILGIFTKYLFFFFNFLKVYNVLKKNKIDTLFIHNGGYPGALSCTACSLAYFLINKKKSVYIVHSNPINFNFVNYPYYFLDNYIISKTSHIVSVSKTIKKELKKKFFLFKKLNIKIILNGISLVNIIKNKKKNKKIFIFNFYGKICYEKGIFFLLKNLHEIKHLIKNKAIFNLYGVVDNDFKITIKSYLDNLKGIVYLKNFLTREKIKKKLFNSNFTVLPSFIEGRSLILLESIFLKIPYLASDIPSNKEVHVSCGKKGFLFKNRSDSSLKKKIIFLIKKKNIRFKNYNSFIKKNSSLIMSKNYCSFVKN